MSNINEKISEIKNKLNKISVCTSSERIIQESLNSKKPYQIMHKFNQIASRTLAKEPWKYSWQRDAIFHHKKGTDIKYRWQGRCQKKPEFRWENMKRASSRFNLNYPDNRSPLTFAISSHQMDRADLLSIVAVYSYQHSLLFCWQHAVVATDTIEIDEMRGWVWVLQRICQHRFNFTPYAHKAVCHQSWMDIFSVFLGDKFLFRFIPTNSYLKFKSLKKIEHLL